MAESAQNEKWTDLQEMKKIIDQLDGLLTDLNRLGREMPVIEKNVRAMKSFMAVLKYGIADVVEVKNSDIFEKNLPSRHCEE